MRRTEPFQLKKGSRMPRGKQSRGKCAYCGMEIAKSGVRRHLAACQPWKELVEKFRQKKSSGDKQHHLRIQAEGLPQFWLDVEMRGRATLNDLDHYLRAIWLECCGHMSLFMIGRGRGEEISMSRRIHQAFRAGAELTHIYDMGTSSVTLIKRVDIREGNPATSYPITLLARNTMPESNCIQCGKPAAWLCMECRIEEEEGGTLCDEHAENHPHVNYGDPIPIVNSPRLGMCGYSGPAEPPY